MRKRSAFVASVLMMWCLSAGAQQLPPEAGGPAPTRQIQKHLSFVDLYLTQAGGSAKTLTLLGDADPGFMDDAQLVAEARRTLDMSLDRAQAHMKHVRDLRSDLGGKPGAARLDALDTHLRDARDASKKLAAASGEALNAGVDTVSTHLAAAEDSLRELAQSVGYTLLRDTSLGRMNVKGSGMPAGQIERDAAKQPQAAPSEPVPEASPPPSPQPKQVPPPPAPPNEMPPPKVPPK